ncbi:unnamed protein product [Sphagnum balticum]
MPKSNATDEEIKARKQLAKEIKTFRKTYKITQRALADLMREPGDDSPAGCRRTIQCIEKALVTPHKSTLTRFRIVKNRIEAEHK